MPSGLIVSIVLHIAMLSLLLLGIPITVHDVNRDYAIVVDLVNVTEITNIKAAQKIQKSEQEKEMPAAPKAMKEVQQKKEPKPQVEETAEPLPDIKQQKQQVQKEIEQKQKKEKDRINKKKVDELFEKAILKTLEETSKKKQIDRKQMDQKLEKAVEALDADTNKEYMPDVPLSLSEQDAIRSQIQRNWNTTAFSGAYATGMRVTLLVEIDMQGNVLDIKVKNSGHPDYNAESYRVFVESTFRAVKLSSPLQLSLSSEKLASLKGFAFTFDSSGMIY